MARILLALVSLCPVVGATELRIETQVYAPEQETPVCESTTLFAGGAVYDFRSGRPTVTIFHPGAGDRPARFVLLDTERKVRTEITTDKIDGAMANLRRWASQSQDDYLRFASNPEFTESFNEETGELQLLADTLTYRLITMPVKHPEAKLAVRQFLDNYTKLQTLLETSLPPEPRLRVNEALFRRGVMPVETRLYSGQQDDPALRAEHLADWMLSKRDRQRIDQAQEQLAAFKQVSNEQWRQGQTLASAE